MAEGIPARRGAILVRVGRPADSLQYVVRCRCTLTTVDRPTAHSGSIETLNGCLLQCIGVLVYSLLYQLFEVDLLRSPY